MYCFIYLLIKNFVRIVLLLRSCICVYYLCITVNCTVRTWLPRIISSHSALITINNRHRTFIKAGMQSYMSRTFGFINFVVHFDIVISVKRSELCFRQHNKHLDISAARNYFCNNYCRASMNQ